MKSSLQRLIHKVIALIGQTTMIVAAFLFAILLRYDGYYSVEQARIFSDIIPVLIPLKLLCLVLFRLFSGWWRYVSLHDLAALVKANLLASGLFYVYATTYYVNGGVPLSIIALDGLLCFMLMSGSRVCVRMFCEYFCGASKTTSTSKEKIVVVGAGATGQSIVKDIRLNPNLNWEVVGYVDQDMNRQKQRFQGTPVLSTINGIEDYLRSESIDKVILANPTLCKKELLNIVEICQRLGVQSKILPNVSQLLNGDVSVQHVRDVQLEDLLGRPPVRLDEKDIRHYLENKCVLVTGAAGSIGREICRQAAHFGAQKMIVLDNAETPLFETERNLKSNFPEVEVIPALNDIRVQCQIEHILSLHRPEVVFHAAAYKHVPMSEHNPVAALENNALGTRTLANAAHRFNVDHFVMVSTDKAVNPTNIMGASKRTAELFVQALSNHSQTSFVTVRFGNVLGSNGSVVPIFQEQIRKGGPVTVTDPEATRFFMTIPEAVQLVLQAGSMGHGGEIFILNMGEQIHIVHMAEELIRLSGMRPNQDIDIVFTGLRPGEKLHEELLLVDEGVMPTSHEKICVARSTWHDLDELNQYFDRLAFACRAMDKDQAITLLKKLVPEYHNEIPRKGQALSYTTDQTSELKLPIAAFNTVL